MKTKFTIALLILIIFGLTASHPALAQVSTEKSYRYNLIEVDIQINPDSTFDVTETQTYNLNGSFGFLYRDIEIKDVDRISDIELLDEAGESLKPSESEIAHRGNIIHLQWNFPRRIFNSESKTWQIKYKVHGGLRFFEDYDELYWNAIFADRTVMVDRAQVVVHLPAEVEKEDLKAKVFVGQKGSTNERYYFIADKKTITVDTADIKPSEYLTIAVGWPKGMVNKPFLYHIQIINWLVLILASILPIYFFKKCHGRWKKTGKDPKMDKTIIAQYEPPVSDKSKAEKMAPALLGLLTSQSFSVKQVTATIIDLAVRGYLKITEAEKKFLSGQEYIFERLKMGLELKSYELKILDAVFGDSETVSSKELKNSFYKNLPRISEELNQELAKTDYVTDNIAKTRTKYSLPYIIMLVASVLVFLAGVVIASNWIGFIGVWLIIIAIGSLTASVIGLIFAHLMPSLTPEGAEIKWMGLGFKEYLHTAERFRIGAETVETFSKFLPYAIIFGVEKQWADRFKDLKYEQPSWYVPVATMHPGGATSINSFSGLTGSISSFTSSISQTFGSAPGGSGVGGGGAAGGGGGGGGGGAG